jgi:hypothetical protein
MPPIPFGLRFRAQLVLAATLPSTHSAMNSQTLPQRKE